MWKTPKDQAIDNIRALYRFDIKQYGFDKQVQIHEKILEEEQRIIKARRVYLRYVFMRTVVAVISLCLLSFIFFVSKC